MSNHSQDSGLLEEKLIRAGALRLDDLAFNQAGELSAWQRRWLMIEVAAWVIQAGINLVLMPCIWVFFYYLHNDLRIFLLGCLLWNVVLGISAFTCIYHAQPVWADIKNDKVMSLSGTLIKHYAWTNVRGRGWFYCGLEIRGHLFDINPSIYNSILDRRTYRLFYIPHTNRLMNIEPLPLSDEKRQSVLAALQGRALPVAKNDDE